MAQNNRTPDVGFIRWGDPVAALLLVGALMTAATRLWSTRWTPDLYVIQDITLLGALAGLLLGLSRFRFDLARIFGVLYGLFVIPWRVGTVMIADAADWNQRLHMLWYRLLMVIDQLITKKPVTDNMLFVLLMAALFWTLSISAGYVLSRHAAAWRIVLPAGLAVLVVQVYDTREVVQRSWFLAVYLLFALLLIVRVNYIRNARRWRETHTHISPDTGLDLARFALASVFVVLLLAWTLPALAQPVQPVADAWGRVRRWMKPIADYFERLSAPLNNPSSIAVDLYGNDFDLTQGSPLSDNVNMIIDAPPHPVTGVPYYWRARIYDEYEDNSWTSNYTRTLAFYPEQDGLQLEEVIQRTAGITATIRPQVSLWTLYAPADPVWFSVMVEADTIEQDGQTVEAVTWRASKFVVQGQSYQVRVAINTATIAQLRKAGTDYPQWVKDYYLQVPDDLTPRMLELAHSITDEFDNPYDKADAVTMYLRENITYEPVIEAPPVDQERLDWFLFDYKQGFCNYYASSEVMLLRSVGIPARLAVGYAEGEGRGGSSEEDYRYNYPPEPTSYVVRQRHSHAWPEVYFPAYGWVEFEPTASQIPIVRPLGERPLGEEIPDEIPEDDGQMPPSLSTQPPIPTPGAGVQSGQGGIELPLGVVVLLWVFPVMLILLVLQTGFPSMLKALLGRMGVATPSFLLRWEQVYLSRRPVAVQIEARMLRMGVRPPGFIRRWAMAARMPGLTRAYLEVNHALKRLGHSPAPELTPAERVASLVEIMPDVGASAHNLLAEYQIAAYSSHPATDQTVLQVGGEIRKMSYRLKWRQFMALLQEEPARRLDLGQTGK